MSWFFSKVKIRPARQRRIGVERIEDRILLTQLIIQGDAARNTETRSNQAEVSAEISVQRDGGSTDPTWNLPDVVDDFTIPEGSSNGIEGSDIGSGGTEGT